MSVTQDNQRIGGQKPAYFDASGSDALDFSVVTLVASDANYERMRKSFAKHGFGDDRAEFVAIDNRDGNQLDGYQSLRAVASSLRGRYVLLTHDDIELTGDGCDALLRVLDDLNKRDPHWMIAGNAGATAFPKMSLCRHIDDPVLRCRLENGPQQVVSLDENFLVMPRARMPFASVDLNGFHLFGTDMCLQARSQGGTAYVIPFLLYHHSHGAISQEFLASAQRFENTWSARGLSGVIRTPSTLLFFGRVGAMMRLTYKVMKAVRRLMSPSQSPSRMTLGFPGALTETVEKH